MWRKDTEVEAREEAPKVKQGWGNPVKNAELGREDTRRLKV